MIKGRLSRKSYLEHFPVECRPPSILERHEKWDRLAKKYLKEKGIIGSKLPSTWLWSFKDQSGEISAFTRSQTRAQIKNILNVKSLPREVKIEKQ